MTMKAQTRTSDSDVRAYAARACAYYLGKSDRDKREYETLHKQLLVAFAGDAEALELMQHIRRAAEESVRLRREYQREWKQAMRRLTTSVNNLIAYLDERP